MSTAPEEDVEPDEGTPAPRPYDENTKQDDLEVDHESA